MLEGYADDSGNNRESHVFVLAGFVGNAPDWSEFEQEWAECLAKPPALEYFKMRECQAFRGQFLGWQEKERNKRLADLVAIIQKHAKASIFALVPRDDFFVAVPKTKSRYFKTPYALTYYALIWATLQSMQSCGLKDTVNFIFDEQLRLSDDVQALWGQFAQNIARSELAPHLGSRPIHGSEKQYIPLQAADLLAWHIRRWYDADSRGEKFESPTLMVLRSIPHWGLIHSKASIEAMMTIGRMRQQIIRDFSREGRIGKVIRDKLQKCD